MSGDHVDVNRPEHVVLAVTGKDLKALLTQLCVHCDIHGIEPVQFNVEDHEYRSEGWIIVSMEGRAPAGTNEDMHQRRENQLRDAREEGTT